MCRITSVEKLNSGLNTRLIVAYGAGNKKRFEYLYGPKPDTVTDEAYHDAVRQDVQRLARQYAGVEADPVHDAVQSDHPLMGADL
jgi:hypothetical protein